MMKLMRLAASAAALFFAATAPSFAQAPVVHGTDAAACAPGAGGYAALVKVSGFKDRQGRLRLQYYSDNPHTFLDSGAYIRRQEVPMTVSGNILLCISVPGPGEYAFVVLHDRDEDGRLSIWSDGVGFSNNPRLALAKPKIGPILVNIVSGVTPIPVVMNYRRGLSVKPMDQ